MSRFTLLAALAIALTGCATAQTAEKMSFSEAFGARAQPPTPAAARPVKKKRDAVRPIAPVAPASASGAATESDELRAELARFAHRARAQREANRRGAPMPEEQQQNWERVLASIDRFLERPAPSTAPLDVARARVAAEAELEMDAKAYGAIPAELAERILDRVTQLAVRMAEVRRLKVKTAPSQVTFDWPIDPVRVTSLFGKRLHPITGTWRSHYGVDLDAYQGQRVTAAADGTVVRAGWNGAHGRQVEIHHANGALTRYSHLSAVLVEPGARVKKGDPVGLAGSSGLSTGSHLHFELWKGGRPVDPLDALADEPSRAASGRVPRS